MKSVLTEPLLDLKDNCEHIWYKHQVIASVVLVSTCARISLFVVLGSVFAKLQ